MTHGLREEWKKAALEASTRGEVLSIDDILSLIREAVEEAKPKEAHHKCDLTLCPVTPKWEGFNKGVSDYHDALIEVLS